jgi:hypothetical protein
MRVFAVIAVPAANLLDGNSFPDKCSNIQFVQRNHHVIQFMFGLRFLPRLTFGNADGQAHGLATVGDQFAVAISAATTASSRSRLAGCLACACDSTTD